MFGEANGHPGDSLRHRCCTGLPLAKKGDYSGKTGLIMKTLLLGQRVNRDRLAKRLRSGYAFRSHVRGESHAD